MSKNKSKNQTKVRPYAVMCTDLYLLWILMVYPLYYADGYFHLPEKKAAFWCASTLIYLGVTLFGVIISAFSDREQWSLENIKKNISMTDIFMFGFLISNLIAFALSEDKVNAWTGASSRYYGAKVLILVCLVYFMVSRYAWVNKVFIWAFLIAGNGVCLLATLDYFGMDVLGINKQMMDIDWYMFLATMGNANTCASYVSMVVAAAITYYCISNTWKDKIIAVISIINCSVALSTTRSDSAALGVAPVIVILIFMSIMGKIKAKNVLQMLIVFVLTFLGYAGIRKMHEDKLGYLTYYDTGIPRILWEQIGLMFVVLIVLIFLYIARNIYESKLKKKSYNKKGVFCGIGIVGLAVVVFCWKIDLYQVFFTGMGIGETDIVGTRMYNYTRTFEIFKELPSVNKIFGCGQASITNIFNRYFGDELAAAGISINSTHNHMLDYFIIGGLICVVCYLGIIFFSIKRGFMLLKENMLILVGLMVIIAYFIQGLFNIDQTNTTTIFWLFIALGEAMCRQTVGIKQNK